MTKQHEGFHRIHTKAQINRKQIPIKKSPSAQRYCLGLYEKVQNGRPLLEPKDGLITWFLNLFPIPALSTEIFYAIRFLKWYNIPGTFYRVSFLFFFKKGKKASRFLFVCSTFNLKVVGFPDPRVEVGGGFSRQETLLPQPLISWPAGGLTWRKRRAQALWLASHRKLCHRTSDILGY